ncbi:MAG: hypothetical protein A2Y25_07910 [Candidatus Melainabacteria bacterium GWF2_37_15]|nr:MAG: hypothetical protein A2Y25_07910 [Candidatus Melainabacteria bacterium GWF2_37_15]
MMISLPQLENPRSNNPRYNSPRGKIYQTYIQNTHINKNDEPLKDAGGTHTQVTFKGSPFNQLRNLNNSEIKTVADALKEIGNYLRPKINGGFDDVAQKLTDLLDNKDKLINLGIKEQGLDEVDIEKPVGKCFKKAVMALPKWLINLPKRFFGDDQAKEKFKTIRKIKSLKNSLTGYLLEIRQLTRNFDKAFEGNTLKQVLKNGDKKALEKFLKDNKLNKKILIKSKENPDGLVTIEDLKKGLSGSNAEEFVENLKKDYIGNSINACERNKLGGHLPKFSNDGVQFVSRAVSGLTTAWFIANDFHNLKMSTSGNKDEAKKQWKERFFQYSSRIGLYAYVGYIINSTFARHSNKSLPLAVALGASSAITADIVSRAVTGVPLYPKKPKDISDKPYVIKASPLKHNPYASPLKTYNALKERHKTNVAFSGNILQKKIPLKTLEKTYTTLMEHGPESSKEIAKQMLEIAGEFTDKVNKNSSLEQIKQAVKGGDVTIGGNLLYRTEKALIDTAKFPFEVIIGAGRVLANLGIRITNKLGITKRDLIPKPKKDKFDPAKFVENTVQMVKNGKIGETTSKFHSPKVMDYAPSDLSTWMKATGACSIPFIALDTYNETIETTKNTNITKEKTKQRIVQDTTRQLASFWAVKSFNDMFKGLLNHSLGGNALGVFLNCSGYEAATRAFVGQPILPKSKEEMKEIDKKRFKKQNWFTKAMGGKIKMHEDKVVIGSASLQKPASIPLNTKFNYLGYN